jgi:von Willebrand factor type A domain
MSAARSFRFLWPLFAVAAVTFAACQCGGANAPCQSDRDCGASLVCLQTQLCAPTCTSDAACSGGKCSASGGCIPAGTCGDNADCATNEACVAPGTCEKRCVAASDCGAGQTCLQNHTCAAQCSGTTGCAAGEKCSAAGGCVPDTGCGSNADCPGQICDTLGKCVNDCRQGKCNPGAYCTPSGQCIATNNPDGGAPTCGGELFQAAKVDSNMLIAFDRSGSMDDQIGGVSKWNIAKSAINSVTAQYQSQIRFGLMIFPQGNTNSTQCVPAPVAVAVGPNTSSAIGTALDAGNPGGRTPIGGVLNSAGMVTELQDAARANYVLLVTDGMETCNGNGVQAATDNLQQRRIRTFVVGFGADVDPQNLSDIATAGGTPRPGTPKYYQADDAAGLTAAFSAIAQGALGCEFKLTTAPPDITKMFIYVNGVLQNRDVQHANGWDYDSATMRVTFYGGLCNLVATDPAAKVSIVYGCRDDTLIEQDRPDGGARLPNGSACTKNLDCANGLCSNGLCGLPFGSPCTTPGQCASQVCTNGTCASGIN